MSTILLAASFTSYAILVAGLLGVIIFYSIYKRNT